MWGSDKISEDHKKLLDKHIIDLGCDDIDGSVALYVRQSLLMLVIRGAPDIQVIITSDGGRVNCGLDIYDMIRLYPGKVTGRVIGYAKSIAAVILQACDVRECARHSHLLIHNMSRDRISLDSMRNAKKREEIAQEMEQTQRRMNKILSERTGQPISVIRKACKLGEEWTATQALHFGLIDKIV